MPKFQVSKSIEIQADPQTVYERVVDFGTWTAWSPWLCAEPEAEVTVSEDPNSVGSKYAWSGDVVGAGELEHRELNPGEHISDEIRFFRPMKSVSKVAFDFEPSEIGTKVTWSMSGSLPFFLFWMTKQIEFFIGMDYERGLKMLKEWIETGHVKSQTRVHGKQKMGPFQVVGVRTQTDMQSIGSSMEQALCKAKQLLDSAGVGQCSEIVTVYHEFPMNGKPIDYTIGALLSEPLEQVPTGLSSWELPECECFRVDHVGSYEHLGNAWSAAHQHVRCKKMKRKNLSDFELYKNDPNQTEPEHLLTEIYLPLK